VPTDDVDALAGTLERLLLDADLRERLGAEARRTYERYLNRSRYAGDVVALFEQVLARRRVDVRRPASTIGASR